MFCCLSIRKIWFSVIAVMLLIGSASSRSQAAALGHYFPSIFNNRDYFVPEAEGVYYAQYTPYYNTDTYHDKNGNKVRSIIINPGPGPGVTINIDPNIHMITLAPVLMWSTPWKILGASYGAYIVPTMASANLSASLTNQTLGGTSTNQSNYAWGDMYIQPIWLDWSLKHWDFSFGEGFYAPVGEIQHNHGDRGPIHQDGSLLEQRGTRILDQPNATRCGMVSVRQ